MANDTLSEAKKARKDEFYTQYRDIEKEMNAYLEYDPDVFRGKTILLPCDDPEWSNFTKYFAQNFERFGLNRLISTSYAPDSKNYQGFYQPTLFETNNPEFDQNKTETNGKIFTLTEDMSGDQEINIDDLQWHYLQGDGDFRSSEITKLRDESDVIITNPPFSLFSEFLMWIMEAKKRFVIIGSMNAITYKEVFPLIKQDKLWLGNGFQGGNAYFSTPFAEDYGDGVYYPESGLVKFRNVNWYTNLDHGKRHQPLPLMTTGDNLKFSKHKEIRGKKAYDRYDNFNAIEVPFTDAIPSDYDEVMGVPISFLNKYSPDQFEIVGSDYDVNLGLLPELKISDWKGKLDRGYVNNRRLYSRILIRHRREANK